MGYESAEAWSQWCFVGFSSVPAAEMDDFAQPQIQSLLELVGAQKVVGSVSPLDPRHLINHKGVTAWHALFTLALIKDREGLAAVSEGSAMLMVPGSALRPNFSSHVNWPEQLLSRYRLDARGWFPFVVPFILHESAPAPRQLQQSLRSPAGNLEIFSVVEFQEAAPEALLEEFRRFAAHIDQQADAGGDPGAQPG
ncbi:hypothetical protein [Longimicrobium terrae]|uniref:Uncharacterized protein n=1 Tax=Longimicrobium terrae TaxID=1639882 RepID=A0A841GU67_9BACT|nr:hypothetical protein [Longimicrobium terrae]MBB4634262.1 hypothetical protein [Longimicrobium terrae]MBB6068848.1 hypothetical protein [Longimicrobium terrae]NNC28028.1 hypothetical protein [Longimicrobium terrae]